MPSLSRRRVLQVSAAASALPLVNLHTASSAGRLTLAFWDHWVPAGNDAMRKVVNAWAEKNHVDVKLDFLSAVGNK
ncbi:MAG: ABC transporter substrate-binding protein, partial [Acetobacteraceae bacterium]|nr:ABC transporter substrate-binding protein [Acetobacteraceae bacterium]